jgi:hypothetical protein
LATQFLRFRRAIHSQSGGEFLRLAQFPLYGTIQSAEFRCVTTLAADCHFNMMRNAWYVIREIPLCTVGWSSSLVNRYANSLRRASTVKVERSAASNTFTARSEPHNRATIHARAD